MHEEGEAGGLPRVLDPQKTKFIGFYLSVSTISFFLILKC